MVNMSSTTKKWAGLAAAAVLAGSLMVLASCGSSNPEPEAPAETSSPAPTSEAVVPEAETETSPAAGMPNPWSEAASAEEAAAGAGLDSFNLPTGEIADLGEPFEITYRYMDGMAEARYEFGASAVTARTAKIAEGDTYDISGDYNTYKNEWTETIAAKPIACAGNREGDSTKTYWGEGDIAHSLVAEGLGGDEDFGLNVERLTVFVEAMN